MTDFKTYTSSHDYRHYNVTEDNMNTLKARLWTRKTSHMVGYIRGCFKRLLKVTLFCVNVIKEGKVFHLVISL